MLKVWVGGFNGSAQEQVGNLKMSAPNTWSTIGIALDCYLDTSSLRWVVGRPVSMPNCESPLRLMAASLHSGR